MTGKWEQPPKKRQCFVPNKTLIFLNKAENLDHVKWYGKRCEKLWRYNQHYFDDLNATGAPQRYEGHLYLMQNWITHNPPGKEVGWEAYPTSLRIVNWIKWSLAGNVMPEKYLQSLAIQVRWLSKNIEWHIRGNHLFANSKALIFAGVFFCGNESDKWLSLGLGILKDELHEQILEDGGHFELSPMYHSIILEDILDLINIMSTFSLISSHTHIKRLKQIATKMLKWLEKMCHPDGEISFFNDSALHIASSPSDINSYAARLKVKLSLRYTNQRSLGIQLLRDSGYAELTTSNAKLILDLSSIGAKYQPGHAHADTLSFEMSVFGKRVFVNRGTSQYKIGKTRQEERGTAAHNTVTVNNQNSSEIWSGFRVGRRANPFDLKIQTDDNMIDVSCKHDGFTRFSKHLIHKRTWKLKENELVIHDKILGSFKTSTGYIHLHPNIEIIQASEKVWTLKIPGHNNEIKILIKKGSSKVKPSIFSPEFGVQHQTKCLILTPDKLGETTLKINWKKNG